MFEETSRIFYKTIDLVVNFQNKNRISYFYILLLILEILEFQIVNSNKIGESIH